MTRQTRILATRHYPDAVEQRLTRDYTATLNLEDRFFKAKDLARASVGMSGLLISPRETLDAQSISTLPNSVKIVGTFSVGTDHIDIKAARQRGLIVTNVRGVLAQTCADLAMMLLLNAARRAFEGDQLVRTGAWTGWAPRQLLGIGFQGKRLGILGMGQIGRALARRASAFDMSIHYCNRKRLSPDLEAGATYYDNPDEMLAISDFLSLNCPATQETIGFLSRERISLLPDRCIVINVSRGELIDERALSDALTGGKVAAAGLDVFIDEPNVHKPLRRLPNVFLMPHAGSATLETRVAMGMQILDGFDAFFAGLNVPNRIA